VKDDKDGLPKSDRWNYFFSFFLLLLLLFFSSFFFSSFLLFFSSTAEPKTMEENFYEVIRAGNVEEVKRILSKNRNLDVNWRDQSGQVALNNACERDQDAIIPILLTHPAIDVNLKSGYFARTPFSWACHYGGPCARLLLGDSRALVNEPDTDGSTPLWYAAASGHLGVIRWWIASGREMNLGKPGDVDKTDAIRVAMKRGKMEVVSLLERFQSDAAKTRRKSGWNWGSQSSL